LLEDSINSKKRVLEVVKAMAFESMFRKVRVALVASACLFTVEAAFMLHGQTGVIASSPMVVSGNPQVAIAERMVLHGVRFRTLSDRIDKRSTAVLDYAVQTIKQSPESLIYVKVQCSQDTSQKCTGRELMLAKRRTQAVASYFEQRGVSRLILLPGTAPYASAKDGNQAKSIQPNLELVQLDLVSGLD
jgi:hypothetical protein